MIMVREQNDFQEILLKKNTCEDSSYKARIPVGGYEKVQ